MKLKHHIAAALGALFAFCGVASAQERIVYNIFTPPTHFIWDVMKDWAAQVEAETEGRVVVEFTAKSVAPPPKVMDAIRKGAADAGFIANVFLGPKHPGPEVGMLPWVHRGDSEASSVAIWNTYMKYFADKEEWKGIELLGMHQWGGGSVCSTTDDPIAGLGDLTSRKVWVLPGVSAKLLQALDVSVVSGPAVQIHEIVSRNVVDAHVGITYDAINSFKATPYTKSCVRFETSPNSTNFSHFFNAKAWARLSEEDQEIIRGLSGEHLARMVGSAYNQINADARQAMADAGTTFTDASEEFVAELDVGAQPLIQNWIAKVGEMGVDGAEALDYMRGEVARMSTVSTN